MKGKRQRKRQEEQLPESNPPKGDQRHPKIKFDICRDSIACFIGDKRSLQKKPARGSSGIKKVKTE